MVCGDFVLEWLLVDLVSPRSILKRPEKSCRIGESEGTSLEMTWRPKRPKELNESIKELSVEMESFKDSFFEVFI